jgi:hypothetical protein
MKTHRLLLLLLLAGVLAGCATPASRVSYSADQKNPASPPDNGFAFGLRKTTVILSGSPPAARQTEPTPPGPSGGAASPDEEAAALTKAHGAAKPVTKPTTPKPPESNPSKPTTPGSTPGASPTPSADKNPQNSSPAPQSSVIYTVKTEICGTLQPPQWQQCLQKASLSSASITNSDLPAYVVIPKPPATARTTLTPKVDTSDPLLLSSVTFNTTSTVASRITQAGTDAGIGLAFGPWGAAAGAVIGLLITPPPTGGAEKIAPGGAGVVCQKDQSTFSSAAAAQSSLALRLMLPVTIDVDAIQDGTPKNLDCWKVMPTGDNAQSPPPSQWFYRVIPDKSPAHTPTKVPPVLTDLTKTSDFKDTDGSPIFETVDTYFSADSKGWSAPTETFPVSACRTAHLQITHLSELISATDPNAVRSQQYDLVVADPGYVQVVRAPTQGSVTVLPLCGGYASAGAPGTPFSDSMNALLQAVQKIKSGQSKSN